jgi:hypothetical protein
MDTIVAIASLVLNVGVVLVGVVLYITKGRTVGATADATLTTRMDAQGREIGELKRRIEGLNDSSELVVRLDERLRGLERTLQAQPQMIALCVGEALKAAWKFQPQPAR